MRRIPRLGSFFWIGLILLAIGLYGLYRGPHFMFDPGVQPEPGEAWYYLVVGVLMMVNGVVHPLPIPEDTKPERKDPGTPVQNAAEVPASKESATAQGRVSPNV